METTTQPESNPVPVRPTRRPSWDLPRPIFDALIAVEEAARDDAQYPRGDVPAYLGAVVHTGVLRDRLAALILAEIG